jgi:hypothetical protein
VQLRYTAIAALSLAIMIGVTLIGNQAIAADRNPAPTSGAATCIAGFTPTPTTWNSTTATSYVCKSSKPACANGTVVEGNTAAISGPLVNEPAQQNIGMSKSGGYFYYTCGVPAKPVQTK